MDLRLMVVHVSAYLFNPLSYKPEANSGFTVLFYVAFIFLVFNNVVMAQVGVSLNSNKMQAIWPLHLLRFITKLKTTVLLIPIYEIMIYGFVCHDADAHERHLFVDPSKCVSSLHVMIPAAIGVAYLTLKAPVVISVFFRINPAERSHSSKTTGRIEVIYTYLRFLLCIFLEFAAEAGPSAIISVVTIVSFIMVYLIARFQPMFESRFNDIRAGIFACSFWSGIQAGICYSRGGYDNPAGFAILCAWLVPGFVSGYVASAVTRTLICRGVYQRMKKRQEQLSEETGLGGSLGRVQKIKLSAAFGSDGDAGNGRTREYFVNKMEEIVKKVTVEPIKVFRAPADVEIACRFLQTNKDPEAWGLANSIFDEGMEQYPDSSALPLMKCHYMADFEVGDPMHIWECLELAKGTKPPFDIRFFIFFEERAMEQEDRKEDLAASHLNITGYAEVMAMERSVRKYHLETVLALKSLWEYLKSDKVAPDCIPYLLARVDTNRRQAKKVYEAMLSKYPNSKQVLRRYSTFLLTVENDVEEATKLINRAEDIENAEAREFSSRPVDNPTSPSLPRDIESYRYGGGEMEMIREMSHVQPRLESYDSLPDEKSTMDVTAARDFETEAREATLRRRQSLQPEFKNAPPNGSLDGYSSSDDGVERRASVTSNKKVFGGFVTEPKYAGEPKYGGDSKFVGDSRLGGEGGYQESMMSLSQRVDELRKKDKHWKSGPASQGGSQASTTSTQKDARQMRYLRTLMESRFLSPINRFAILMNVASVLLLGVLITGCVITILTYGQIAEAVSEAFTRMQPRASLMRMIMYMRTILTAGAAGAAGTMPEAQALKTISEALELFTGVLYGSIENTAMPLLYKYNLNDRPTYWMKVLRFPTLSLKNLNPYFLMEFLYTSGKALTNWPVQAFLGEHAQVATETRVWLDNILDITNAFEDMATRGASDFLESNLRNMTICYGLMGATMGISLLVGLLLFRPILEQTRKREIQILSLIHVVPRKYINEKVDELEVEVENILEEMDDETDRIKSQQAGVAIPSENVMRNSTKRKLTKHYLLSLLLFALCGACMYAPAIQQSQKAVTIIVTIEHLADRLYGVTGSAAMALELIAQDQYSWKTQEARLWFEQYLLQYESAHTELVQQSDGGPSLYDFPSAQEYEKKHPLCHLHDPNGCDPAVRAYDASIGFTEQLVTSSMEDIYARWYEMAEGFLNDPPATQTFESPRIRYITNLVEDIAQATQVENDLLVQDISSRSSSARSLNIFLFVLALAVLLVGYVFVFRNVVETLRKEMLNISQLYLSLPPGLIQTVPELKRFVESGGAVMPTLLQQKK
ncbi:hypothetical protein HK097_008771 [Rhizophlyctis rosea]|uniref:TmcB/TmcC TPR repeats domain-containing protein n=1 Tax=Rhizophlyctis rosea TaxID=64517 RepID=A0AAD5S9U6_9FUNG|nr:hypothetical protein HK097_008771 [Rhizophlyctis rosea]